MLSNPQKQVTALLEAGKVLLGDDFRIVPEFGLTEEQADEWQNAYDDREKLLEYQIETLKEEFPVDSWLYGIARVREKMHHVENTTILVDSFCRKGTKIRTHSISLSRRRLLAGNGISPKENR